jgi:hypothetical protein
MTAGVPVTAFLDASVLYPAAIRSILLYLALEDLYRPLWSNAVHHEWIEALLRNRPDLDRARLMRTRALMEAHFQQAMVTGFDALIDGLILPDPNDRHVLAAAIHGGATVIVTANLSDFLKSTLAPHGIQAEHPDAFVCGLIDREPSDAITALRTDRLKLKNPPKSVADYLAELELHGMRKTVTALKGCEDKL